MTGMDHDQAERSHAAERYALREMPAEEAEQFELHYFGCTVCAEQLKTLRALAVNARALEASESGKVLAFPSRVAPARSSWWPAATAAGWLVAAVLGWQHYQSAPAASGVEPMAAYALRTVSRGEPNRVLLAPGISRFALYLDPVWDARPASYQLQLSGPAQRTVTVPAPVGGQPLYLSLDRTALPPGLYQLTVTDPAGTRLAGLEFDLQMPPSN
jgi:hypothetical protein